MIFHEIIGNINEIDDLNGYHVETIYLNSEDMLKRILDVIPIGIFVKWFSKEFDRLSKKITFYL